MHGTPAGCLTTDHASQTDSAMQELLQEIQAQPVHRLRYQMQLARVRDESLTGWRARSVQTRKSASLHSFVACTAKTVPAATTHADVAGRTLWLN